MARLGRRRRQIATTWFGASELQIVTIVGLIDRTGVTITPTVTQDAAVVQPGLIDRTGAVFSPSIAVAGTVTVDIITQTGAVFNAIVGAQYAYAISDISNTGVWTNELDETTGLYASVDETEVDILDYIKSPYGTGPSMVELEIGDLFEPDALGGHVLRYYYAKDQPGHLQRLTVRLMCGAVTIASWVHTDLEHSFILVEHELSESEADTIADYSDLRVQFETEDIAP